MKIIENNFQFLSVCKNLGQPLLLKIVHQKIKIKERMIQSLSKQVHRNIHRRLHAC